MFTLEGRHAALPQPAAERYVQDFVGAMVFAAVLVLITI